MRRSLVVVLVLMATLAAACGAGKSSHHLERATGDSTTTTAGGVVEEATSTTVAPPATSAYPGTPGTARRSTATTRRPSTGGGTPGGATPAPAPPGGPNLAAVRARLTQITSLSQPVALAVRNGDPALYFAQKTGSVVALRGGGVDPTPVVTVQVSTGSEQGLLGVTFSPDGSHIYINYTDPAGDTHVVEYAMAGGYANGATRRELLFVDQPFANHNGGNLVFGPDGQLWIGLGDGGSGGDPNNNAQNPGTPLGKILRMNVANAQYSIWAMGLRNPWRYSFDRATGSVWIGDVGQNQWEEIDFADGVQAAGVNYGWARFEGTHIYNASRQAPNAVPPIYEYSHDGGNCSVTGGYVYRGTRIPALNGGYLFADFCAGHIFGLGGGQVRDLGMSTSNLSSFGQDLNGELYALSLNGPVYRIDPA